jgi:hypothetical protein
MNWLSAAFQSPIDLAHFFADHDGSMNVISIQVACHSDNVLNLSNVPYRSVIDGKNLDTPGETGRVRT